MPGPNSNPTLTADIGRNLRDRHPEIFRRVQIARPVAKNRAPSPPSVSPPSVSPAIPPIGRRSLLGRLMAAALGLARSPK